MKSQKFDNIKKFVIILCIIGFCVIAYFMVYLPLNLRGEGDPYFIFSEVQINMTTNRTIIHLEDKDIINVRGLDVRMENGKISRIYFRNSQNPAINNDEFNQKYGSSVYDPSSRKYLEYNGVYYYAIEYIP